MSDLFGFADQVHYYFWLCYNLTFNCNNKDGPNTRAARDDVAKFVIKGSGWNTPDYIQSMENEQIVMNLINENSTEFYDVERGVIRNAVI